MKAQQIKYLVTNKESISSNESNIYRIGHHNKVPLIDHSNMQTKAIEERAVVAFVGFRHIFIVRLAHLWRVSFLLDNQDFVMSEDL